MKLSKKFLEDLDKIGQDAFVEKNMWIGKLVPDIIVDNLKKRGITPDDFDGMVCLTVEEAEALMTFFDTMKPQMPNGGCMEYCDLWGNTIKKRIEQAEGR